MTRLRDERGGVLVIAAVLIPLFLLMTALVVDAGTWFTHKRQLQNRADAGALAAGVQYAAQWAACFDPAQKDTVAAAIDDAARRYAGDPQTTGTLYNTDVVTEQSRVNVEINSTSPDFDANTSWNDTGINGLGPCDKHPADAFSPANSYWVDVKVKEVNQRTLFGAFGLDLLKNRAQARVELKTVAAGKGFLPIALPDQDIRQAEIRYYRYCGDPNPELLATKTLRTLGDDYQNGSSGMTLWGPTLNDATGGTPTGVDLPIPSDKKCSGSPYSVYMPIRAEVRIAGVDPGVLNVDNFTCSQLAAMRYADCWEQVSDFSVDGDNPRSEPWFHEVELTGGTGSGQCGPDAYFAKLPTGSTSCTYGVRVRVDWNDLANNPPAGREFTVSLGGTLDPPGPNVYNGVWTGSATNATLGQRTLTLSWTCTEPDTSTNNPNDRRNCPGTNGGAGGIPVHSLFLGNRQNSGILELVRTSRNPQPANGQPGAELHWYPAPQIPNQTITVYPTVGLEGGLYVGQRRVLRAPHCKNNTNSDNCDIDTSSPNSSQSIDCEPNTGGQGHDFVMFANGCRPWYGFNHFDNTTWWPCPDRNGIIAQPNSRAQPWLCVVKAPGFSPPVIADGIAAAIGNCSNINNNSCQQTACTNVNFYDPSKPKEWALHGGKPSKRVVFLFIVPYGAYKNTGPQDTMPVLNFAAFYVTGWEGNGGNQNPCRPADPDGNGPGIPDETTDGGDIVGYFVDYTVPDAPGDPDSVCEVDQLKPCTPVLVR